MTALKEFLTKLVDVPCCSLRYNAVKISMKGEEKCNYVHEINFLIVACPYAVLLW